MDASHASPNKAGVVPTLHFATARDYLELLKPRVMSLVIFTAFVGMMEAGDTLFFHPVLAWIALLCIAVGAGAAGALNMWFDADIDAQMARTRMRPIPEGRILPGEALGFGTTLAVGSVLIMGLLINLSAAVLLAATIAFYLFVYTMWLKRRTSLNIVIGGVAGALPPVIGALAVTGTVPPSAVFLFLIVFFWTPPHSWALALLRNREYERVGVPMLPALHGVEVTCRHIGGYSVLLVCASLLPIFYDLAGSLYFGVVLVLDSLFLAATIRLWFASRHDREGVSRHARFLFRFSILYLFLLMLALLADSVVSVHS